MIFRDRLDAGRQLAKMLIWYKGTHPLICAIPRGAVPMAGYIADQLGGDLDVVLVRKLGAPGYPETAIGAIDEEGWTYIASHAAEMGADDAYIETEKAVQLAKIKERRRSYTSRPALNPADRVVIVVDDGLATGATMIAALHALRRRQPAKLICAVPVSPSDTLEKIRELADEVVCLYVPDYFRAVGEFYDDFPQVEDAEVIRLLNPSLVG